MLKPTRGNVICKVTGRHEFGEWKLKTNICEEIRICKRCGLKEWRDAAHQWKEWEIIPGRCIERRQCSHCSSSEQRQLEHKWSDWETSPIKFKEMRKCLNCAEKIYQVSMDLMPETVKAYIPGCYLQVEDQVERDRFIQAFQDSIQGDCIICLADSLWVPEDGGNEMSGKYHRKNINLSETPLSFIWDDSALKLIIMWGEERIGTLSSFHIDDFQVHKNYHLYLVTFHPEFSEWGIELKSTDRPKSTTPSYNPWEKKIEHHKHWYGVRNW